MTKRRLSDRHRAGIRALAESATGSLYDKQLRERIGLYATNVINSLADRRLIVWSESLALGDARPGSWSLTDRGERIAREMKPAPVPCCPTCGQALPAPAAAAS